MAFKPTTRPAVAPDSPELLVTDLPRRKIVDLLPHQSQMLATYGAEQDGKGDIALQLPTGSGKTLVGLLIAEWRRLKFQERVVYLCPNNQLVHQVKEQAEEQYGMTVTAFTGKKAGYDPEDKSSYEQAQTVAVTNYSSLFNTKPYFKDPDVVILDDAHAAENYIAALWSLTINPWVAKHKSLHQALRHVLQPHLTREDRNRLAADEGTPVDWSGVNKLPTPVFAEIRDEVAQLLDAHAHASSDLEHPWKLLRGHLHACHLYISTQDILIRPLIPPTWTHEPFANARQRIYMSATLGESGDLERLTGQRDIHRIKVAGGWDKRAVGRRFFIFPGLSLDESQTKALRQELMKRVDRSLVLVPSDKAEAKNSAEFKAEGFTTFSADDIEQSKKPFVNAKHAVAVVANRYDGIDFPGKECRLLFIEGLPRAVNSQERFIMEKMGANAIYNERIQTRVLQAVGRCTRALNDSSAVVVTGMDLPDYLGDLRRRRHLHPELQAELQFGIEQSTKQPLAGFIENFETFLEYGAAWEKNANGEIVNLRAVAKQQPFPDLDQLRKAVRHEVDYQEYLWASDFTAAMESAQKVLSELKAVDLQGYRALWNYLAGSAAWLGAAEQNSEALRTKARAHFATAKKGARGVAWLNALSRFEPSQAPDPEDNAHLMAQLEKVEMILARLGTTQDTAFARYERELLEGLNANEHTKFEPAQKLLGELLGFEADKIERDGSPDPWWLAADRCIVFEAHSNARETSSLNTEKARQAATHENWMREYVEACKNNRDLQIRAVLVSPVAKADEGAIPHLKAFSYWNLTDFRAWAHDAMAAVRELRKTFSQPGDLVWRAEAAKVFVERRLAATTLFEWLRTRPASDFLK